MAHGDARTPIWVWPVVLVLVTALAALSGMVFFGPDAVDGRAEAGSTGSGTERRALENGRVYYVWVKMIELEDRAPDGDRWDVGPDSAPDIRFELVRDGARLQKSEVREDTLIARWDPISVDVKQMLLSGTAKVDLAGLIHVPLIRVEADSRLELLVRDHDFSLMPDETAGTVFLDPNTMYEGENTLHPSSDDGSSIRELTVVFFREDLPMADLIRLLSER
jgi:hypothetical protein